VYEQDQPCSHKGSCAEGVVWGLVQIFLRSCTASLVWGPIQMILPVFFRIVWGDGRESGSWPGSASKDSKEHIQLRGEQAVFQSGAGSPKSCAKPCVAFCAGFVRAL